MSDTRIDIRSKEGFSWHIKFFALVFIIISFIIISDHPIFSAILSFICLLILTARTGIEIDKERKTYQEYMSFFFVVKMGKPKSYEQIEKVKVKEDEELKRSLFGNIKSKTVYRALLKFEDEKTVHLFSDKDESIVRKKAKVVAEKLGI